MALDESELPGLDELHRRATANGVPGLELIGAERLRELEPHAAGVRALYSPRTAVVDFGAVARALRRRRAWRAAARSCLGREVSVPSTRRSDEVIVETPLGELSADARSSRAPGLQSDRVAAMSEAAAAHDLGSSPSGATTTC